ncbi:MAG: urease accessory protein UreD, partial [Rhizobiaceae bacterium]
MLHIQLPTLVPMQRAFGRGECFVKSRAGVTAIDRLWQEGCAKIRLPKHDHGFEAVMINSSGGLTGGDRMHWRVHAGVDTAITVTTQACEKIYAASDGVAEVQTHLSMEQGSRLNWLPQETILFDRSALARTLNVELAADAQLLL